MTRTTLIRWAGSVVLHRTGGSVAYQATTVRGDNGKTRGSGDAQNVNRARFLRHQRGKKHKLRAALWKLRVDESNEHLAGSLCPFADDRCAGRLLSALTGRAQRQPG